jgi:hypothetical protein
VRQLHPSLDALDERAGSEAGGVTLAVPRCF